MRHNHTTSCSRPRMGQVRFTASGISSALKSALSIACCCCLLVSGGCMKMDLFRFQNAEKDRDEENRDRHKETDFVGNFAAITGNNVVTIHGVGLVTGLDNTGEDPAPSIYRTQLEEDMKKRGVQNFREKLQSRSSALVLLTAYLPADIQKGGTFDVEVRLPPNTQATSLRGGWLLPADLFEQANVQGQGTLKGKTYGRVTGPILVSYGKGESQDGIFMRGRILGGGVAGKERTLGLYLRSDFKNRRNVTRIADAIGARFHSYDRGLKKSLAEAKDDQYVQLKVHSRYKDNYPRYMQVIRHVAFRENDIQRRDRMERLQEELVDPDRSARAAIQYEAIGTESILFLKKGLNDPSPEVRFYSAEALAYLGNDAGAEELAKLARTEPAFRVYCMAALSALDEAVCYQLLRELMNESSAETKYGAFRAMWTLNPKDPFINGMNLNDQFLLHVVDSKGDSMIHLTRHRRPEIVLFGANQEFRTPLHVNAGNHIGVNAKAGSNEITLTRFELGRPDQRKVVSTKVADVIVAVAELGATYPDVAQLLSEASDQYNIQGRLEFDALPQAGRLYYRTITDEDGVSKASKKSTKVGRTSMNPNLFPVLNGLGEAPEQEDEIELPVSGPASETDSGEASLTDISKSKDGDKAPPQASAVELEDVPPAQGKSKSWRNLFGKPKVTKLPDELRDKLGDENKAKSGSDSASEDAASESLPPPQSENSKFEIE